MWRNPALSLVPPPSLVKTCSMSRNCSEYLQGVALLMSLSLSMVRSRSLGLSELQLATPAPTDAVKTFLSTANETRRACWASSRIESGWLQQNFITDDTQALSARASQAHIDAVARLAKESTMTTR